MSCEPITIDKSPVYLDHNATTPPSFGVIEAMGPFLSTCFANPSSPSPDGERSREAISLARRQVAEFLGARSPEIVFTSGGTESNISAILSALELAGKRRKILSTPVEHPSVMELLSRLSKKGFSVEFFPLDPRGGIDSGDVARMADDRTALVLMMHANNETGMIFPVEETARIAHSIGARIHVDGVAAAGKIPVDLGGMGADTYALSGHKIYGPKGTGVLFVRENSGFAPLFPGSQERKRRSGTENVPGIVGIGRAAFESVEWLSTTHVRDLASLRDRFEENILDRFSGSSVNGSRTPGARVPGVASLRFSGVRGEKLLHRLVSEGIWASTGSACSTGSMEPSHVLLAMGLSREEALSTLRFSLGRKTTRDGIERALAVLDAVGREWGLHTPPSAAGSSGTGSPEIRENCSKAGVR